MMTGNMLRTLPIILLIVMFMPGLVSTLSPMDLNGKPIPSTMTQEQTQSLISIMKEVSESINWSISNGDMHSCKFGIMFNRLDNDSLDGAMDLYIDKEDCCGAIQVARLAESLNYNSTHMNEKLKIALSNISMAYNLPLFDKYKFHNSARYLLNGYRFAEDLNCSSAKRWNVASAYNSYKNLYIISGKPFLWGIPPNEYYTAEHGPRWYDECAQTLDVFLRFYELGINESLNYALDVWNWTNDNLWNTNESYYKYGLFSGGYECEVGFYHIALRLRNYVSDLYYFDRVLLDSDTRLTANKFQSPQWRNFSIIHTQSYREYRLPATFTAYVELHTLYPLMKQQQKTNFVSMLKDSTKAWEGLIYSSPLYNQSLHKFRWMKGGWQGPSPFEDKATMVGLATLFLQGIVPDTGSLAIPIFEECYEENLLSLNDYFRCDIPNRKIRIPVYGGKIGFQYGDGIVYADFPSDGVYEITFSDDWNGIERTERLGDLERNLIYVLEPEPSWDYPFSVHWQIMVIVLYVVYMIIILKIILTG